MPSSTTAASRSACHSLDSHTARHSLAFSCGLVIIGLLRSNRSPFTAGARCQGRTADRRRTYLHQLPGDGSDHAGTGGFRQRDPVPISRFSGALVVFVLDRILIGSFGDAPGRVRVVGRQGVAVVRCWGRRGRSNR